MNRSFERLYKKLKRASDHEESYAFLTEWSNDEKTNELLKKLDLDEFEANYKKVMEQVKIIDTLPIDEQNKLRSEEHSIKGIRDTIIDTCKKNIWYFLANILQVPKNMISPEHLIINPYEREDTYFPIEEWSMLYFWCKENKIPLYLNGFEGMGWTVVAAATIIHNILNRNENAFLYTSRLVYVRVSDMSAEREKVPFIASMVDAMISETIRRYSFLTSTFVSMTYLPDVLSKAFGITAKDKSIYDRYLDMGSDYIDSRFVDIIDIFDEYDEYDFNKLDREDISLIRINLSQSKWDLDRWDIQTQESIVHYIATMEALSKIHPRAFFTIRTQTPYLRFSANISQYIDIEDWDDDRNELKYEITKIIVTAFNSNNRELFKYVGDGNPITLSPA